MKFWNRYDGDIYSHISISLDNKLTKMYSFARKTLHNPFNAGLIKENIYGGMFSLKRGLNRMAVFRLRVSEEQYGNIGESIKRDWERKEELGFNFPGLFSQLVVARGIPWKDRYFCSQWIATLLRDAGIDLFHKPNVHVRPFDFYCALRKQLIFEGLVKDYRPLPETQTAGC